MRHWRVEFACPATPPCKRKVAWIHSFRFLLRSQMVATICACFASNIMIKWELFCQASPHGPPTPPWHCLPSCSQRRFPGRLVVIRLCNLRLRIRIMWRLRHLRDEAIQRTMTRLSFHLIEGHLWPKLDEMRDTDKASFLDTPTSLQKILCLALRGEEQCRHHLLGKSSSFHLWVSRIRDVSLSAWRA